MRRRPGFAGPGEAAVDRGVVARRLAGRMVSVEPAQAQELPRLIDGRYQPTRLLGQGAFARTMACLDVREGERAVALKELRLQGLGDWKPVELFEREAQVLASLRHTGVPVFYRHFEGRDEEG